MFKKFISHQYLILLLVITPQLSYAQPTYYTGVADHFSNEKYSIELSVVPFAGFYHNTQSPVHIGSSVLFLDALNDRQSTCAINGNVHIADGLLGYGIIYIIDSTDQVVVDSFIINNGSFSINNIGPGTYYLLAKPLDASAEEFLPTYYVSKTVLEESTVIRIENGMTEINKIDIRLMRSIQPEPLVFENKDILLYPNPAIKKLMLQIFSPEEAEYTFTLINIYGKKIKQTSKSLFAGDNIVEMDIETLESGWYAIEIRTKQVIYPHKRFIKR